jgi:branched-chain amino acid transport system ATP-binding protein
MLEVYSVRTFYGKQEVIRGLSLEVGPGEVVSLIGPNSAGKTTMLRSLAGLKKISEGRIILGGIDITAASVTRRVAAGLVLVPEGRQIFPHFTVRENLLMGGFHRADRGRLGGDIEKVYATFPRLREREAQSAGSMSGGEQQMLAIGRGLMSKPSLMLFDEPSLGLAPIVVDELKRVVRRLAQSGMSILLAEQNDVMALECSDRSYVIESGVVVDAGLSSVLAAGSRDVENPYSMP